MSTICKSTAEADVVSLNDIEDEIECVICLEAPQSVPVYQCENGHLLCTPCRDQVSHCPICRILLGRSRNLIVEKVLEKFPRFCKFRNQGCTVKLKTKLLSAHIDICHYKPIQCPLCNIRNECHKLLIMTEMANHMINVHKVPQHNSTITFMNLSEYFNYEWFKLCLFKFNKQTFCGFFARVLEPGRRWCAWLSLLGTAVECDDYDYTVNITCHGSKEEITYTGQVVSLHVGQKDIISMGRCLLFEDELAKRLSSNKDTITLGFDIRHRLKEGYLK